MSIPLCANTDLLCCTHRADWEVSNNLNTNYARQGFLTDTNAGFGRNIESQDTIQVRDFVSSECLETYVQTRIEPRLCADVGLPDVSTAMLACRAKDAITSETLLQNGSTCSNLHCMHHQGTCILFPMQQLDCVPAHSSDLMMFLQECASPPDDMADSADIDDGQ